jgi:hypothetical protein
MQNFIVQMSNLSKRSISICPSQYSSGYTLCSIPQTAGTKCLKPLREGTALLSSDLEVGRGLSVSSLGPDAPRNRHSPSSGKLQLKIIWIARPKNTLIKLYVRSLAKNLKTGESYRTETGSVNDLFRMRIRPFQIIPGSDLDPDTTYKACY